MAACSGAHAPGRARPRPARRTVCGAGVATSRRPPRRWISSPPGDGAAWARSDRAFERIREPLIEAILPAVPAGAARRGARPAARARPSSLRFAALRRATGTPFRRRAVRRRGRPAAVRRQRAAHRPAARGRGQRDLRLAAGMLGQTVGFPVPGRRFRRASVDALVARLRARGGRVRTGAPVERIEVARRPGHRRPAGRRRAAGDPSRAGRCRCARALPRPRRAPPTCRARLRRGPRAVPVGQPDDEDRTGRCRAPMPWTADEARAVPAPSTSAST